MLFFMIFAISAFICSHAVAAEENVIQLPQGKVQGLVEKSYGGREFLSFLGIPFAKPPVGDLRFGPPQPADKWNGTLVANKKYVCLQFIPVPKIGFPIGDEDCLYMYVYIPRTNITGNENLDVVAYIHGGGLMFGSPTIFAAPDYIMDKDVIFVSFNYRLSLFGFLSTEDHVVSGNMGLKDQVLALKWIQENIKYFGGNPNSVTLYGLSGGAISTHLHYFSPLSKGLFHRGFAQSGSALMPEAIHKNPMKRTKKLAEHFSCPTESSEEMIACLKKQNVKDLVCAVRICTVFLDNVPFALFGPVVEKGENPFLDTHPYQLLEEGKIYDVPFIASNVNNEGIFPTMLISALNLWHQVDNWTSLMPYFLELQDTVDAVDMENVTESIRKYYFQDKPLSLSCEDEMIKLFTDRMYKIDSEKAIRLHAKAVKSPVYYMLFTYELIIPFQIPAGHRLKGVGHGDDSVLFAPMDLFGIKNIVIGRDVEMMHICTSFLESFAKGEVVNFNNVTWEPVTPGAFDLNVMKVASPKDVTNQKFKEMAPQKFWGSLPIYENEKRRV